MNCENVDTVKKNLDTLLLSLPDQPTVTGLGRPAETNSVFHQISVFNLNLYLNL